jgi:hypothetical protein
VAVGLLWLLKFEFAREIHINWIISFQCRQILIVQQFKFWINTYMYSKYWVALIWQNSRKHVWLNPHSIFSITCIYVNMNNMATSLSSCRYKPIISNPKHENYLIVLNLRKSQCYLSESEKLLTEYIELIIKIISSVHISLLACIWIDFILSI